MSVQSTFVNQSLKTFVKNLVKNPSLDQTPGKPCLFKRSLKRFDAYNSHFHVDLCDTDDLVEVIGKLPSPGSDLTLIVNYLIVVRQYLVKARDLKLPYHEDQLTNLILSKISYPGSFHVLVGDYLYNLYYNINSTSALSMAGGLSGAAFGCLVGFPIGFFSGGVYLMSRPYILLALTVIFMISVFKRLV